MGIEDDIRSVLANPSETATLDFKRSVGWSSLHSRIELARDVVCLANRNGGRLVIGVEDLGGGKWKPVGLSDGDPIPDPTDLGKLLRNYFDPPASFTIVEVQIDGLRFGIVQVDEFARTPIICKAIGNDEHGKAVVRPGYFYRRSDAMECAAIETAAGVQSVIEAAVVKTGAAVGAMIRSDPAHTAQIPTVDIASEETLRFCDLIPREPEKDVPILDILARISASVVRTYGGVMVPRSIDPQSLAPSAVVREPARVLIERTRDDTYGRANSLIEVSRGLSIRLREGLWESEGTVDFTALFAFTFACLVFAKRFYDGTSVRDVRVHLGLTRPLGRRLVDDPTRFTGFNQTYVATSAVDIVLTRDVTTEALQDADRRTEIGHSMMTELAAYFGFVFNDDSYEAHLKHAREFVAGLAE